MANKKLYAKKVSEMGGVTVRDTTTNVNTTQVIPVIEPIFKKDNLTIKVGEKAIINMVDILGRNFSTVKNTDLYTITSSSPDSIKVIPSNQSKLAWEIEGLEPNNEIKLVAKNKVTGTEEEMVISVACTQAKCLIPDGEYYGRNDYMDIKVIVSATVKDGNYNATIQRVVPANYLQDDVASGTWYFSGKLQGDPKPFIDGTPDMFYIDLIGTAEFVGAGKWSAYNKSSSMVTVNDTNEETTEEPYGYIHIGTVTTDDGNKTIMTEIIFNWGAAFSVSPLKVIGTASKH